MPDWTIFVQDVTVGAMQYKYLFLFWILFFAAILYIYLFHPELFNRLFQSFQGPGSPFVNEP